MGTPPPSSATRRVVVPLARLATVALVVAPAAAQGAASSAAFEANDGLGGGPIAPQVDAGPDLRVSLPLEEPVRLQGSASHQGKPLSIHWEQLAGPAPALDQDQAFAPELVIDAPGLYAFRLLAAGLNGATAADDVLVYAFDSQASASAAAVAKWQTTTIEFDSGFVLAENGDNPFRNYRLQVFFYHVESQQLVEVPGYFAADGQAADTGATSGSTWRVHFTPDRTGAWMYLTSFRTGTNISTEEDPLLGTPIGFDGESGSFLVTPYDPNAPGFRRKGALRYMDEPYLRFAETGEPFLKAGSDSPENLLGYYEFDNTNDTGGNQNSLNTGVHADGLHHFDAHLGDYVPSLGAPYTWQGGKGQRLLGALTYLASKGVNSLYFLTYNTDGGDGREVWPWMTPNAKGRFDCSKLDQWERVFAFMERLGIHLHVVTQETENDHVLDGGTLGPIRKLYYRELVARFGHHLALTWNLGEENTNSPEDRRHFADYIRGIDPYAHPITIHAHPLDIDSMFGDLLGYENIEGPSLQLFFNDAHQRTIQFVDLALASDKPWVVMYDEQIPANLGIVPDSVDFNHDEPRNKALWGTLLAQGAGVEYYFGFSNPHDDLDCEDFRSRDRMWDLTDHAMRFFGEWLPYPRMVHGDGLTPQTDDYVLAWEGETYAIYRPTGGAASLDLKTSTSTFEVRWFDPRNGGGLRTGSVTSVAGPGVQSIGLPPSGGPDWVALVRNTANAAPSIIDLELPSQPYVPGSTPFRFTLRASDPNGVQELTRCDMLAFTPAGIFAGNVPIPHVGGELFGLQLPSLALPSGIWTLVLVVFDEAGRFDLHVQPFFVQ